MTEEQDTSKRPSHLRLVSSDERPPARPKYSADAEEAYLVHLAEMIPGPEADAMVEEFRHHRRLFEQLVAARVSAGLSQAEVAKRMRAKRAEVERLESGGSNPRLDMIERYVAALGKKIEWRFT
jgi:ribosome-binding protein aMBF1 (putative translation factor)